MPSAGGGTWDEVAEQADALPDGWRHHGRRAHLELVAEWVGTPQGRWLKTDLYEERGPARAVLPSLDEAAWTAVDVSPVVCAQARAICGVTPAAADVRALSFADAAFDGVLSTSTLDHFDDRADIGRSLVELHRVLRPGGHLVVTFDNGANPLVRLRNALPRHVAARTGLSPFPVGHTVDESAGRAALAGAGFDVLRVAHLHRAPHVVGTRPARWGWYEREVLPRWDRLAETRLGRWTGHYVAFLARRR